MQADPMIQVRAPSLVRLTATEARARTLIARHGADMRIAWSTPQAGKDTGHEGQTGGTGLTGDAAVDPRDPAADVWRVSLTAGANNVLRDGCDVSRDLEWAGSRLRLSLPASAVTSWLGGYTSSVDLHELEEPLLSAAVEELLSQVCAAVGRTRASSAPRVSARAAGRSSLPHCWTVTVHQEGVGPTFFAILECDALGMMLLASLVQSAPPVHNGVIDDTIPLRLSASLGWSSVKVADLQSLRPLDVLFIDNYVVSAGGELWLTAGNQGIRVVPQGTSYCITEGWTAVVNEIPMHDEDDGEMARVPASQEPVNMSSSSAVFDVDSVPVTLTFSLGERVLTCGELKQLQPGETFDLARPLDSGPVIVRVNGAFLGTGDLVEIDGRVGVALRELGNSAQ